MRLWIDVKSEFFYFLLRFFLALGYLMIRRVPCPNASSCAASTDLFAYSLLARYKLHAVRYTIYIPRNTLYAIRNTNLEVVIKVFRLVEWSLAYAFLIFGSKLSIPLMPSKLCPAISLKATKKTKSQKKCFFGRFSVVLCLIICYNTLMLASRLT